MLKNVLKIGSRGSQLALWQANWVKGQLESKGFQVEIVKIKTTGDKILDVPLAKVGGKGLFVKEIEEALLRGEIDLAVHSMKDVPSVLPEPLHLAAIPKREDPRDALISRRGLRLADLPSGAKIGTSSLRRQAQLWAYRPDLDFAMLRGNLDTRLRKLTEGEFEAIILAAAGLHRMGWTERITEYLSPEVSLPAIGQGALGI
ncbi:MAG: hydroxymethylbilane synthase, partial [Candidatus Manganitrophaceae bacterium]